MNSETHEPVESRAQHLFRVTRIAALVLFIGSTACIEIEGGAVELSWSLRSFEGNSVSSCGAARIDDVVICWQPVDGSTSTLDVACRPGQRETFPCPEENGVSGFEIPPGPTAFWIEPICRDGEPASPSTYQVPPPIVRTVEEGRIATLNSLLIVVTPTTDTCPDAGCTCVR